LLIIFTYLQNDSVFGFAWETGARALGNFCCPGRPQILSFFFDIAKVQKFQIISKFIRQKNTRKSTQPEWVHKSATRYSATVKKHSLL